MGGKHRAICTVHDCHRVVNGLGLCNHHYYLQTTYGTTDERPPRHPAGEAEFWPQVKMTADCWHWTGSTTRAGYGRLGGRFYAHKFAFEQVNGQCPRGFQVDHTCHNTGCVRPEHLRLATNKQNCENRSGPQRNSTSGVRGVSWVAKRNRWVAVVRHHGTLLHVGYFKAIEDAEAAAIQKRNELFTHNDKDRINAQ